MHRLLLLSVVFIVRLCTGCEVDQYEAYPARDGFSQVCEGNPLENYTLVFNDTDNVISYLATLQGVEPTLGALYGFNRTTEYGWEFSPDSSTTHKEKLFSYMYFFYPPGTFDPIQSGYDVDPYNLSGMEINELKQLSYFMNVSAGTIQPETVPHFNIYYSEQDHGACESTLNVSLRLNYEISSDIAIEPLQYGDYLVYADLQIKPSDVGYGTVATFDAEHSLPAGVTPHDVKHRIICAIALSTSSTADAATFSIQAVHIHQKRFYMRGEPSVVDPYNMPESTTIATTTTATTTTTTTTTKHLHVHEEDLSGYVFSGILIVGILIILFAMLLQKKEPIRYEAYASMQGEWFM